MLALRDDKGEDFLELFFRLFRFCRQAGLEKSPTIEIRFETSADKARFEMLMRQQRQGLCSTMISDFMDIDRGEVMGIPFRLIVK